MPSTINKGYSVQLVGSNSGSWGAGASYSLNEGVFQIVDTNLAGVTTKSLSATNVALTQAEANNGMLRLTGTLTASIVISPDAAVLMLGMYYWENLTTGSFSVTVTPAAGSSVVLPQSRRGTMWIDTNGARLCSVVGSSNADVIPVGTIMPFYQNAAPAGWTINSSLNDYGLRIVSSSGGVTSGTVNYGTLFGRTKTDSHTLTTAEMPSHTHTLSQSTTVPNIFAFGTGTYVVNGASGGYANATVASQTVGSAGSGGGHTHDIDMRVKTASFIIASKN